MILKPGGSVDLVWNERVGNSMKIKFGPPTNLVKWQVPHEIHWMSFQCKEIELKVIELHKNQWKCFLTQCIHWRFIENAQNQSDIN